MKRLRCRHGFWLPQAHQMQSVTGGCREELSLLPSLLNFCQNSFAMSLSSSGQAGSGKNVDRRSSRRGRKSYSASISPYYGEPERYLGASVFGRRRHRHSGFRKDETCFDICLVAKDGKVKLGASLFARKNEGRSEGATDILHIKELRPGMILLKAFISYGDQVEIVKTCRELGLGPGGFYRPSFKDGSKLHLWMMCLGKNWDPQTKLYEDIRSVDGSEPPSIPCKFRNLVKKAILASHEHIKADRHGLNSVEEVLPKVSPDLCVVNFYTHSGRLGLHQDKDESWGSIEKGLPIVSFSLGDSADFVYSEHRDVDNASKIVLESGDVLIFGGKSRLVFHGVPRIHSGSAPAWLQQATNLRGGRLNLTFRQY